MTTTPEPSAGHDAQCENAQATGLARLAMPCRCRQRAAGPSVSGQPTPTTVDLDAIEEKWLRQCGACDAGMGTSCVCAEGDPRNVIANLVDEVKRLRSQLAEACAENDRLVAAVTIEMKRAEDRRAERDSVIADRDEARSDLAEAREQRDVAADRLATAERELNLRVKAYRDAWEAIGGKPTSWLDLAHEINTLHAERDSLREERDKANAVAARLGEHLSEIGPALAGARDQHTRLVAEVRRFAGELSAESYVYRQVASRLLDLLDRAAAPVEAPAKPPAAPVQPEERRANDGPPWHRLAVGLDERGILTWNSSTAQSVAAALAEIDRLSAALATAERANTALQQDLQALRMGLADQGFEPSGIGTVHDALATVKALADARDVAREDLAAAAAERSAMAAKVRSEIGHRDDIPPGEDLIDALLRLLATAERERDEARRATELANEAGKYGTAIAKHIQDEHDALRAAVQRIADDCGVRAVQRAGTTNASSRVAFTIYVKIATELRAALGSTPDTGSTP